MVAGRKVQVFKVPITLDDGMLTVPDAVAVQPFGPPTPTGESVPVATH